MGGGQGAVNHLRKGRPGDALGRMLRRSGENAVFNGVVYVRGVPRVCGGKIGFAGAGQRGEDGDDLCRFRHRHGSLRRKAAVSAPVDEVKFVGYLNRHGVPIRVRDVLELTGCVGAKGPYGLIQLLGLRRRFCGRDEGGSGDGRHQKSRKTLEHVRFLRIYVKRGAGAPRKYQIIHPAGRIPHRMYYTALVVETRTKAPAVEKHYVRSRQLSTPLRGLNEKSTSSRVFSMEKLTRSAVNHGGAGP